MQEKPHPLITGDLLLNNSRDKMFCCVFSTEASGVKKISNSMRKPSRLSVPKNP